MTRPGPSSTQVAEPDGSACIALPESPTTGYRWELEDPGQDVHVERSDFVSSAPALAGGGGTRTFHVHLRGLPALELAFVLRRAWESHCIERRIVTITKP